MAEDQAALVACDHDDCSRPRQPYGAYCCNICAARDLIGLSPGHNEACEADCG